MAAPPAVLVLDDGELDDVQRLLEELRIPCARVRGGAIVSGTPAPKDLLIATPRRIEAVEEAVTDAVSPPIRVMVAEEDSYGLRSQLRRRGFDFLVRRPVHPEALRLLLMHCVYKGEERRREPRVAVGLEVSFRTGLMTRGATLVDLSVHGCRLLTRARIARGKRVKVQIPGALESGEPLVVPGRVVRTEEARGGDESAALGVAFPNLAEPARQALELLIEDRAQGPATLGPVEALDAADAEGASGIAAPEVAAERRRAAAPRAPTPPLRAARAVPEDAARESERPPEATPPSDAGAERRAHRRAVYSQTVPAFGNRALRVLVGRDLSVRGMRIQPLPELELGDRLHLAIYGEAGEEPMLIWGSVARNDGDDSSVILFDPVDGAVAARLEQLVTGLPAVESLHDSEVEAMGTVLTEIVG